MNLMLFPKKKNLSEMYYLVVFIAITCFYLLNPTVSKAATSVTITVINLPNNFEGVQVALVGTINDWNNNLTTATVTNHSISFHIDNLKLSPLGIIWTDIPRNANTAFSFVNPGTWTQKITGNYGSNNFFRVTLADDINNTIIIDAQYFVVASPLVVDQTKGVSVNGKIQLLPPPINPNSFAWPGGKWKALIMSYDDAPIQDTTLVSLFNANGIVGTFNLTSGSFDDNDHKFMPSNLIKKVYENHEIANHSVTHPSLSCCIDEWLHWELKTCNDILEKMVGYKIRGLAYPFGNPNDFDNRVIDIARNVGIIYARTAAETHRLDIPCNLPSDLMRWNGTTNDWDADNYGNQLIAWNKERVALLYIWGHSHFLDGPGWDGMKAFCKKIGNRKDIWYAKSIEVADYLNAVWNLAYTENSVYNPSTTISVWIKSNIGIKELKPGQTLVGSYQNLSTFTVYFKKPESWGSNMKIYYWKVQPSGTLSNVQWPGIDMSPDSNGWYKYTFTKVNSAQLIFNDGGTNKTVDLQRDFQGWYMNGEWHDTDPTQ